MARRKTGRTLIARTTFRSGLAIECLERRRLLTVAASGLRVTIDVVQPGQLHLSTGFAGELLVNDAPIQQSGAAIAVSDIVTLIVNGSSGDDMIDVRSLPDTLQVQLLAGDGDDLIAGAAGYNELYGGSGNDTLLGGPSGDFMNGDRGDDYLFGAGGGDFLKGDRDNDIVRGGDGDDFLSGGNGMDLLLGGGGNNHEHGNNDGGDVVIADGELGIVDLGFNLQSSVELSEVVDTARLAFPLAQFGVTVQEEADPLIELEVGNNVLGTMSVGTGAGVEDDFDVAAHVSFLASRGFLSSQWHDEYVSSNGLLSPEMILDYIKVPARLRAIDVGILDRAADAVAGYEYSRIGLYRGPGAALNLTSTGIYGSGQGGPDTIYGGSGPDELRGTGGDDWLFGGGGNDLLIGMEGNDHIFGSDGDDSLVGSDGNDTLRGGAGNDNLAGDFTEIVFSEDGTQIEGHTGPRNFAPLGEDVLFGGDGNDTLNGGGLSDVLFGDDGDDVLQGEYFQAFDAAVIEMFQLLPGGDALDGGAGNDTLSGNLGDDTLQGRTGDDSINGDEGDDTLFGDHDNDLIFGGPGEDLLFGGAGNDVIHGGDGDDALRGNGGHNRLQGGLGFDSVIVATRGKPTDLSDEASEGTSNNDVTGKESGGNESGGDVSGGDESSTMRRLIVSGGEFHAIDGVEQIRVKGDSSNDQITLNATRISGARQVVVHGGAGHDFVSATAGTNVSLVLYGQGGNDTLQGARGHDRIFGGSGRDLIDGRDGNDSLNGGGNPDTLLSGTGEDTLTGGGRAVDRFIVDLSHDTVTDLDDRDSVVVPDTAL